MALEGTEVVKAETEERRIRENRKISRASVIWFKGRIKMNAKKFKYIVITFVCVLLHTMAVLADDGQVYYSEKGQYSFMLPDGFEYNSALTAPNQEAFANGGQENFNISIAEATPEIVLLFTHQSDELKDVFEQNYTSMGISSESITWDGYFNTEENDRTWFGMSLAVMGMNNHICITCEDDGTAYTITFSNIAEEDENTVLNSFSTGNEPEKMTGETNVESEAIFADFKGNPLTLLNDNSDSSEEISEGFLYVIQDGLRRRVSFDRDSDDIQYGTYSLSGISIGSDFRDLDQIIELEPETAYFKTSNGKAGPYSKEDFTKYFPADWVDLNITWYQNSSGKWIRANNSEMQTITLTRRPSAGWEKIYSLSVTITSEGTIEAMFIVYGDAQEVVRFQLS